jgi:hypothetical protein
MNQAELQKQLDAMIEKQYNALGVDTDDPAGIQATPEQQDLVVKRYAAQIEARVACDPEFKAAYCHHVAAREMRAVDEAARPIGEYNKDAILPLDDNMRVVMSYATRDHLIKWALRENDSRNLAYIKSRLDLFDAHPECKTLSELEAALNS